MFNINNDGEKTPWYNRKKCPYYQYFISYNNLIIIINLNIIILIIKIFLCLGKHQQLKPTNLFVAKNSTEKSQALHLLNCSVPQT